MENTPFDQLMQHIIHTLEKNGYNPVFQLEGYLKTGDPTYITGYNNARNLMSKLEPDEILEILVREYLKNL